MRYFFKSKLEENENGYVAHIPFNIWEVARQRDEIHADAVMDNEILSCTLLPIEKGKYDICFAKESIKDSQAGEDKKILLHVTGSLEKMGDSPYSLENPIRKIDNVDLLLQKGDGLCGQTCIAMLAGVTIDDVIKVMNCEEWQGTMGKLISALNYYGLRHTDIIVYPSAGEEVKLPKCCIVMEKMGRFSHYLIHFNGKFYDPNIGVLEDYDYSKILGYLEVYA